MRPTLVLRPLFAGALIVVLTSCATLPATKSGSKPGVAAPNLGWLSAIKTPGNVVPVLQLAARGAQVFRCERQGNAHAWVFRQPDAELVDPAGAAAGRHGANFSFEHADGSRLIATIVANDEAPNSGDLRWLLLTTKSYGQGAFDGVTHVQRVNTRGGMPPASCDPKEAGRLLRVPFTSDFVFYRPRSD